jgi:membrane fusion protein (multidrug efflux system)
MKAKHKKKAFAISKNHRLKKAVKLKDKKKAFTISKKRLKKRVKAKHKKKTPAAPKNSSRKKATIDEHTADAAPPASAEPQKKAKSANPAPAEAPPASANNHRKRTTWIVVIICVLCGLIYLIYWLAWGQFSEETDDSYVNGNMIMLTPQESGIVTSILTDNTQLVDVGQPLVELDPHDFEITFEQSKADLANAVRLVSQMFIKVDELEAKKQVHEAELLQAHLDYRHRKPLVGDGSISLEEFEHSETALNAAFASLVEVENELEGARAEVENTSVETHPKVEQAKALVRKAFLALYRTTVRSPVRGIVGMRRAQVGQWVEANDSLMAIVPIDEMWVDANFREVSLKHFRIGQSVKVTADMYGSDVQFHGQLVGLNPGTGSVFSVLPPQNATGNWIKIIQRIPVKISLDPEELKNHPLVLGLTMRVTVDTHERDGLQLPRVCLTKPVYSTDIYRDELDGVEEIIDQIIMDNAVFYDNSCNKSPDPS